MRLDHLLSKEQLAPLSFLRIVGLCSPPAADVGGGCSIGGDTGELGPATVHMMSSTAGCPFGGGWWERRWWVRLGLVVNTLLGPEGTSTAPLRWGLDCLLRAFLTLMRNCWAVPGVACGGVLGLVVV